MIVFWGVLFIIDIIVFSLFWFTLSGACLILTFLNFLFFYKCRGKGTGKIGSKFDEFIQRAGMQS